MTLTEPAGPLAVQEMTSTQLVRRAKLVETVIELVGEVGPDAVQMRDVAERSGIALGTAYRYFASKEHLLAVALAEWQERLTRRVLHPGGSASPPGDPAEPVVAFLRRELRAFARAPQMGTLMVRMHVSTDPYVRDALARMSAANTAVMRQLLAEVEPDTAQHLQAALDALLMNCLVQWTTGRQTMAESAARLDAVARLILAPRCPAEPRA